MQTLGWARKQGFKPVALHPSSKAAVNKKYAEQGYVPPGDELWRDADYGVGILCGPAGGGPIDGDLDCPEAVFFAPRFLPSTRAVFGRKSKPRSHMLYRVDAPTFDKRAYVDPVSRDTILELRGDGGHQTVFPGSVHEGTGELVEWDSSGVPFPEVPVTPAEALLRGARMVAIATLIVRYAWTSGYHNEPCKHLSGLFFYLDWPLEDAEALITAVMELSDDHDKSRIPTVRATYRRGAAGRKITGAGTLRKQLGETGDRVVDRILDWSGMPAASHLSDYNERFAVVTVEGRFRVADTDVPPGEPPVFMQKDDFLNMTAADYVEVEDKSVSKGKLWLASARRRSYRAVDFLPGVMPEESNDVLNLWTGWGRTPEDPVSALDHCAAWRELLLDVICGGNAELNAWLLHWFAGIVRDPMHKALTAPVIIGKQGAGKSLLLNYFGSILGPGYVVITNEEHIYGRFNRHLAGALLLHSEEALYGGEKKHRGIIKSLITDEWRIFEPKGIDAKRVRNYLRMVLTSNYDHAAPVEVNDRRFTIYDMGDRIVSDELRDRVLEEWGKGHGPGPAALHRWLLDMEYDPAVARTNVKNEALRDLKGVNFTPLEGWWYETLSAGRVLPDFLSWATRPERDDWPEVVSSSALYCYLVTWMRDRNARQVPSETAFALQLNRFVGRQLIRAQRTFVNPMSEDAPQMAKLLSERQNTILNMPELQDCREAFERHHGQLIDWPGEDDEQKTQGPSDKF